MSSLLHNDEAVKLAAESCTSIAHMLRELGVARCNYYYIFLRKWSERTGNPLPETNYSDLNGRRFNKTPDHLVFTDHSAYTSNSNIKRRLIQDYGWEEKCALPDCPNPYPTWRGKPLSLQLDHINGISNDNRFENLRFLCPNCHTQTDTFGSRNRKVGRLEFWCACGNSMARGSSMCIVCHNNNERQKAKDFWPPVEEIIELLKTENYVSLGKKYGVSDNAIRKYLQREGVDPLPKGNRRKNH